MKDRPRAVTPHYGVPPQPYIHGQSRIKLRFCRRCETYQPARHPCVPVDVGEEE